MMLRNQRAQLPDAEYYWDREPNRDKEHSLLNLRLLEWENERRKAFPLNPAAGEVEGHNAFAKIADLPSAPESLSIVTPPAVTRQVVQDAIAAGVKHIWMQPGAEDAVACQTARQAGINVIDDGSCILVLLARTRD